MVSQAIRRGFSPLVTYIKLTVVDPIETVVSELANRLEEHSYKPETHVRSVLAAVKKQNASLSREVQFEQRIESVTRHYLWHDTDWRSHLH